MERVNPKISSTCRASKQYSSFRGAVSPLTLGGGRSPFRINVPRSAREVSRFLVHETQTERKEEEERKGDVSQYKTTIFWNYEREPGCAWGGGGGHGERKGEREREREGSMERSMNRSTCKGERGWKRNHRIRVRTLFRGWLPWKLRYILGVLLQLFRVIVLFYEVDYSIDRLFCIKCKINVVCKIFNIWSCLCRRLLYIGCYNCFLSHLR